MIPPAPARRDVTLLSTADWEHPFWTNKQHVACTLAELGHRVLYVESVGLRPPRFEGQDLIRLGRRLWRGLQPPRLVRPRLWVWSPLLIPAPRTSLQRRLNRIVFSIMLRLWRRWLGIKADLLWTYNPLCGQLLDLSRTGYRQLVYHCVDDLAAQPCMPASLIESEEARLCRACDQVFVTSRELLRSRGLHNARTSYYHNVADLDHFAQARNSQLPLPLDLRNLPAPRLGFVGAISGYKLDLDLLKSLALHRPDCQLVLIGRVGEGDPDTDLCGLQALPNVHLLGPKPYCDLPAYLRGFDLALLPCPINAYTRSMFPMKFFEYLAAGLPVVATALPALEEYRDLAWLCEDAEGFLAAVDARLAMPAGQDGQPLIPLENLSAQCSYRGRTEAMLAELSCCLVGPDTA